MKQEVININNKAVAILRVSSRRQADGISHDVQEQLIRDYCKDNGFSIEKVFKIVESAKDSEDRVKYHEAMTWIAKNKIGNVLFYVPDREARNLTDLEENARKVMKGQFNIHYVQERKVLHQNSPDSDFLTRDFQGIMAANFIRILRIRVNDAMKRKAESGWFPSNHPPLGYVCQKLVDPETGRTKSRGGIIAIDPIEKNRKWVLREFELRAQGLSYEDIRLKIMAEGLVNGKKAYQYRASAIERRIKNPFYRGQFIWKGVTYEGKHERLIPREWLEQVDARNGLKATYIRRDPSEYTTLVGGWMKCSCGCNIIYDPKTKTTKVTGKKTVYHYYRCSNGKYAHENQIGMTITAEKIWNQFSKVVEDISISEEFAKDIADALNQTEKKAHRTTDLQVSGLKAQEKELEAQENRLHDFLMDGTLDRESFSKQLKRVRENRESLIDQLAALQKGLNSAVLETAKTILELATTAKSQWISAPVEMRRTFLNKVLSNPVLDGLTVRYELKKPFAVLLEMSKKEDWRPLRDSNSCLLRERELS